MNSQLSIETRMALLIDDELDPKTEEKVWEVSLIEVEAEAKIEDKEAAKATGLRNSEIRMALWIKEELSQECFRDKDQEGNKKVMMILNKMRKDAQELIRVLNLEVNQETEMMIKFTTRMVEKI